jgi:hypothetical protein
MRSAIKSDFQSLKRPRQKSAILRAIQKFWEFSNFYGEYNSLDPSQRRKFILDKNDSVSGR